MTGGPLQSFGLHVYRHIADAVLACCVRVRVGVGVGVLACMCARRYHMHGGRPRTAEEALTSIANVTSTATASTAASMATMTSPMPAAAEARNPASTLP